MQADHDGHNHPHSSSSLSSTAPLPRTRQRQEGDINRPQESRPASHEASDTDADPERFHFQSVLASFEAYLFYSLASNNLRRRSYYALSRNQRTLLNSLGGKLLRPQLDAEEELQESSSIASSGQRGDRSGLKGRLDEIDDRIRRNATFLDEIVNEARGFLGETSVEQVHEDQTSIRRKKRREESEGQGGMSTHDKTIDTRQDDHNVDHTHTHTHATTTSSSPPDTLPSQDVDKVRSTLKQFVRDWSSDGASERSFAYDPILQAILKIFGSIPFAHRHSIRLLFPGCGLGRLPWEAAMRGFSSQGNEFSFFMLLASHFVLNKTNKVQEHVIYPWIHTMSNWRSSDHLLQPVKIPDVDPNSLNRLLESNGSTGSTPDFSMVAGDFLSVYNTSTERGKWSAVCTTFFLDTARNPITYLETISNVLPVGGYWINLGPLLWHFEGIGPDSTTGSTNNSPTTTTTTTTTAGGVTDNGNQDPTKTDPAPAPAPGTSTSSPKEGSIELTLEEVLDLIEKMGFTIEERRTLPRQSYTGHAASMLTYEYQCEFWVARKVRQVERTGYVM